MSLRVALSILLIAVAAEATPPGQIAYATRDDGGASFRIHVINPDGSGRRALATGMSPSWSPDGERIVFVGPDGIALMDRDGANVMLLLEVERAGWPTFSHDGRQILFTQIDPNPDRSVLAESLIYVMDAVPGAEPQPFALVSPSPEGSTVLQGPTLSPDGGTLAFLRYSLGDRGYVSQLYLASEDGSGVRSIGPEGAYGLPRWSPDGSRMAFYGHREDGEGIYTADADGSNQTLLSPSWNIDWSPTWSPDGEWIAFLSSQSRQGIDLFIMRPDGTQVTNVTQTDEFPELDPAWSPVVLPPLSTAVEQATWAQVKLFD